MYVIGLEPQILHHFAQEWPKSRGITPWGRKWAFLDRNLGAEPRNLEGTRNLGLDPRKPENQGDPENRSWAETWRDPQKPELVKHKKMSREPALSRGVGEVLLIKYHGFWGLFLVQKIEKN